jgi:hypothetical protein
MKLGIYLNSQHRERDDPARRLAETLEQARLVRALGFDSICIRTRSGFVRSTPGSGPYYVLLLAPNLQLAQHKIEAGGHGACTRQPVSVLEQTWAPLQI